MHLSRMHIEESFAYSMWNFRVYFILCELSQKKWPEKFVLCGFRTDLDR